MLLKQISFWVRCFPIYSDTTLFFFLNGLSRTSPEKLSDLLENVRLFDNKLSVVSEELEINLRRSPLITAIAVWVIKKKCTGTRASTPSFSQGLSCCHLRRCSCSCIGQLQALWLKSWPFCFCTPHSRRIYEVSFQRSCLSGVLQKLSLYCKYCCHFLYPCIYSKIYKPTTTSTTKTIKQSTHKKN